MLLIKHHSYYRRCKTKYRWRSVDALLMLIFRMWLGVWVSMFCTSRRLIRRKWTVTYQCQYFTISSSISECDHNCETRKAEPEIGPDRSSQTRRNPRFDGYGPGFGPPWVSGWGIGRVWNRTDPFLSSNPGPLVGYPDQLLTLYRWTHSATRWQPAQFRRVGYLPSNRTLVACLALLTTRAANVATVWSGLRPGPEVMVLYRCYH